MDAVTALCEAKARRVGIRRPGMPEGVMMVPVVADAPGKPLAFLVTPRQGDAWSPTLEDVMAMDWTLADWRDG